MKHDDIVDCVAFSPDGLRVVTGSWDKMARLWDVSTPKVAAMSRERLLLISEVWSGFRVGEDGTQQHFSAGEFLELRRKLGDDDPLLQFQRERQVRFALGRALYAAQSAEDRRSGFAAAFHWRRLIQFRRALAEADPLDATKQLALMVSHSRLGEAQIQLDQYPAAIKQFRQGITVLDAMIEKKLLVESATREKAILQQRIEFCPTAALATGDWETLLKTDANDLPKLLSIRVTELGKRGRMADIAQAGGKLTELEPMTWDNFYNAARAYGLCATLVVNGKPTPTEAEQGEQKRFIDLSLACLKVAIAAGYDTFEHMRQDTDLTPLHGLPEFEALFPKKEQK